MSVLIINQSEVERLLPMDDCLALMREAFERCARGEAFFPLRPFIMLPDQRGVLAMMPGYLTHPITIGVKVITVFPNNLGTPLDAHQGPVLLFDAANGALVAMLDASALTAIRTAAATAVATDVLARDDAETLAILGSGVQAATHLEAIRLVRDIRQIRLWSRTSSRARAFAKRESERHGVEIQVMDTPRDAVDDADIVCTTTGARDPIVLGNWLRDGMHLNAVGSASPKMRELDTTAVAKARLFVDSRESALNEAGDILIPKREGVITDDHIVAEIGDVLIGRSGGRRSAAEITLFKSLGVAAQDLVASRHVYGRAIDHGVGTAIDFGGRRN